MSHELRTPLNSIIGFTGIILKGLVGPLNEEQNKQLGIVKNSAHHLLNLINDVLDISKIEAGQLEIKSELMNMPDAIEEVTKTVIPMAEKKGLSFDIKVGPDVGQITSDRRRMKQILINLINNAIKFTPEGGSITLTANIVPSSDLGVLGSEQPDTTTEKRITNTFIVISVKDTGIGIRPEDMETLFKPFHQVDSGLARKHEGTGLGLSICKRLVEMLGGEIKAESEFGKGSKFTFKLPLRI